MFITTHSLVGASIGLFTMILVTPNTPATTILTIILISIIAFASHFVLDAIPHYDGPPFNKKNLPFWIKLATADVLLTIALLFFVFQLNPYALIGAFFAALPDALQLPFYLCKKPPKFLRKLQDFHERIHKEPIKLLPGLLTQGAIVLAIVILFRCTTLEILVYVH